MCGWTFSADIPEAELYRYRARSGMVLHGRNLFPRKTAPTSFPVASSSVGAPRLTR